MQPPTPFANLPNLFADNLLHVFLCFGLCVNCQQFNTLPVSASITASAFCTSFSICFLCVLITFACCVSVHRLLLWPLHFQFWCWLFWIVFYLLVVHCCVFFCCMLLTGSPLEVVACHPYCACRVFSYLGLSCVSASPLELAECWEVMCFVGSCLYHWPVVEGLVPPASSQCCPVSWFLL